MIFNLDQHKETDISFAGIIPFFLILFFVLIGTSSHSQNQDESFQSIDKKTYLLYTQKNWDSLIEVGKHALKSGTDYYYLRLRLGIAYYYKENYLKAIQHLEKAFKYNSSDAIVNEYLYYSYQFSNRKKEARALASKFTPTLKNKLQAGKVNFFEKLYFETGPTFSNNIDVNSIQRSFGFNSNINQEQDLNDNKYYVHFGFELNLSKSISAYLGYNFLTISKLKQIRFPGISPPGNNNNTRLYNDEYKLYQNEFYGNMKFFLGKGFMLTSAYHMLNVQYNTIYPVSTTFPFTLYDVTRADTSFTNHVTALTLNKSISQFNIGITTSWSNLNYSNQYQLGGIFTWYPIGNLNIYTTTSLVSAWEEEKNQIVFDQLLGGKVGKQIWMEGYITLGEMVNYNEKNAFVVHNSGDIIKFRTGINFIVLLSEKLELSIRYIYLKEQGYSITETMDEESYISEINYQNNTIIGGLKWTF